MTRKRLTILAVGIAMAIFACILSCSRSDLDYHRDEWIRVAIRSGRAPTNGVPLWDRLFHRINSVGDYQPVLERHQKALIEMGYLERREFRAPGQRLGKEFWKIFLPEARSTFPQADRFIWTFTGTTNLDGIVVQAEATNMARWKQLFDESIALATNAVKAAP
jgi:hypothetical protein